MRNNVQAYLKVPFEEKDEAKSLGAWWDSTAKKWYVPKGKPLEDFSRWMEEEDPEDNG
jgi:hypothetical protein